MSLILIVEDNEKNLKLVRDVLQFKGYRTLEAETGQRWRQPLGAAPASSWARRARAGEAGGPGPPDPPIE